MNSKTRKTIIFMTVILCAALINKAAVQRKINLDDTIETSLPLPKGREYPGIKQLLIHTSGYKGYYFESPMISKLPPNYRIPATVLGVKLLMDLWK